MKILRRNLSLMLAVRYLNPLRTMFSIITLICLGGVALGVMVLIVVLSVMEGLQKEMEDKGFALQPHYTATLEQPHTGAMLPITEKDCDWRAITEGLRKHPNVLSAYPKLEGMSFVQTDYFANGTLTFSAVESDNAEHLAPLKAMLKEGSFDLGMDNKCVIAYKVAQKLGLQVGSKLTLTPVSGNIEQMADIMQKVEGEMLTQSSETFLPTMRSLFDGSTATEHGISITPDKYREVMMVLLPFLEYPVEILNDKARELNPDNPNIGITPVAKKLRSSEAELCAQLYDILSAGVYITAEDRDLWNKTVETIATLDRDKENGKELENLRALVVPVDLEVIGIYQTPENMPGPDLYLPLCIAQEAVGYTGDHIMGICLRLKDPHNTQNIEDYFLQLIHQHGSTNTATITEDMPPPVEDVDYSAIDGQQADTTAVATETPEADTRIEAKDNQAPVAELPAIQTSWKLTPWKDALEAWYKLIANERVMMSFVLSIITLIASFCIMAVMFTMSMQRKREIAVLQALGATSGKIVGIFAWQGLIIGFVGAITGVGLALLVLYYRLEIQGFLAGIGLDPFPMEAHGISLPAVYDPAIFAKQAIIAFIMVTIASIIPAIFVSRQDPAQALRSN